MDERTALHASHLHLLGRAASQVFVHFGRYGITPTVRLDLAKTGPPALDITLPCVPAPAVLERWWAFEWHKYFHAERTDDLPDKYWFILWPCDHF